MLFADDTIIFTNGSKVSLSRLLSFLETYEKASGQRVNKRKCSFLAPPKMSHTRIHQIANLTGFHHESTYIKYLGVPLCRGRIKASYFQPIIDKIQSRVSGWFSKLLSFGGKIILLRYVLSSMPLHLLAAMNPPVSIFDRIERVFAAFLLNSSTESSKHHWISWDALARPTQEGGIGVRRLSEVGDAFTFKRCWSLVQKASLWSDYLSSKYFPNSSFSAATLNSGCSRAWRNLIRVRPHFEKMSQIMLGDGSSGFFLDNWSGLGALKHFIPHHPWADLPYKLISVRLQRRADDSLLTSLCSILPSGVLADLIPAGINLHPGAHDKLAWTVEGDGAFSIWSAYNHLHQTCSFSVQLQRAFTEIFTPPAPLKISFLMLRALRNRLPLDDNIKKLGIPLASACCCKNAFLGRIGSY